MSFIFANLDKANSKDEPATLIPFINKILKSFNKITSNYKHNLGRNNLLKEFIIEKITLTSISRIPSVIVLIIVINLELIIKKYNIKVNDVCYIGANRGQEIPMFIKHFPNSKIHCFEPQKDSFKFLVERYQKFTNLFFYNFALGSENKFSEMYINNNNENQSSSFLKPKEHLNLYQHVTFSKKEKIEIKKFCELEISNVNFLKIDVQGYELEVLKGFNRLIEIDYIFTEVNRDEMYEGNVLIKDLDKYLNKMDFIRVETKWWGKTHPWGDAFYLKKKEIFILIRLIKLFFNHIKLSNFYFKLVALSSKIKQYLEYKLLA